MPTNFPTAIDVLINPAGTDPMSAHAAQHASANDAIEAIQAKVGVTGSTDTESLESDVRLGVTYGPTGTEYTGTMAEGGGSYPTAESIAAAVLAALQATTIPVNVTQVNDVTIKGVGTPANQWNPA